eukprot:7776294-Pyramimonas_sp.AAC.1
MPGRGHLGPWHRVYALMAEARERVHTPTRMSRMALARHGCGALMPRIKTTYKRRSKSILNARRS